MSSSRTAVPPRELRTSFMYTLPVRRLKEILSRVVPDLTLGPVEELSNTQLARLYILTMSDNRKLLLSFAPSLTVRLLRHETTVLYSEALLVSFIAGSDQLPTSTGSEECKRSTDSMSPGLSTLVPKLLKHSSNNREMAYPYSIFEPTAGEPLSNISLYLSLPERRLIDKQIGSMARRLSSLTSPSGKFGTVSQVLPDPFVAPLATSPPQLPGFEKWSEVFNNLLESILRDGEDMTVLLPYESIRSQCQRLSDQLDAVTQPRLVILNIGSERNVMVERGSDEEGSSSSLPVPNIKLTGLRSWSQGYFGDPLISDCFEDPSEGFLEGWREGGEDIIDHDHSSEIRLLLYRCFRAVVAIVTEHYRPQIDSSRRELEGRRKLTSALAELEKVETGVSDAVKRGRSSSGSDGNSKRPRLSNDGTI